MTISRTMTRYEIMQLFNQMKGRDNVHTSQISTLNTVNADRKLRCGFGSTVAILALGASVDIGVTWSSAFTSTDYMVDVSPAAGLIGNGTAAVLSKTTSGITVRVTASVLLAAGASFVAVAMC